MALRKKTPLIIGVTIIASIVIQYAVVYMFIQVTVTEVSYQRGRAAMFYTLLVLLWVGLLVGIWLAMIMEKMIFSRLARLSDSVTRIGVGGDLSERVSESGRDEIANLAGAINGMLTALEQSNTGEERYRNLADKLSLAHKQFQNIIEFLPEPTFAIGRDKKIIFWNRALEKMTGVSKVDIIGRGDYAYALPFYGKPRPMLVDFVGTGDIQVKQHYDYVERKGDTLKTEVFVPFLYEGQGAFLRVKAAPFFDGAGNPVGAIETISDITKGKQTEQDLKLQKVYFQQLFDNSPEGIVMLDNTDKIIDANMSFERLYQYSVEEIKGRSINEVIVPDGQYEQASAFSKSILNGKVVQKEAVRKRKDGSLVDVKILGYPILVGEQQVGICGIYSDITERKKFVRQLEHLSLHDHLTGLYNRNYFEEEMQRLNSGRYNPVGIIICDIDGLKLVNDTMGHEKGDALLVTAAGLIRGCFRDNDVVARIGGDEFVVLLPNSDDAAVTNACRRIRCAVVKYNEGKPEIPLNISIGYAVTGDATASITELFKDADNNMYRDKLYHSQSVKSAIVQTLMKALEERDYFTKEHAGRLRELVANLAVVVGLPERRIIDLRLLAQFHDIGKVGIPDRIIFKEGPLNHDERTEMQRHSEVGYRIAQSAPDLVPIADWILKHHEWWNGTGYPLGLKGEEIPLECRILAIADAYDAMTSDRPYRKAMSKNEAVIELSKNAGIQFDPNLVPRFLQVLENTGLPGTGTYS